MERSESPLTIKEHTHALTRTHTHMRLFSFDGTVHDIGPGALWVSGIQLCKTSGVKQLRVPWHFCIPSEMSILRDLSELVLTVRVK